MNLRRLLLILLVAGSSQLHAQNATWQEKLEHSLPLLGHRNWIVVADPAFPLRTSPGIEVVATNLSQPDLLSAVMDAIARQPHVLPIFYADAELPFVTDQDANGIGSYQAQLKTLLRGAPLNSLAHDQLLTKLDEDSRTYHVLVLKSTTTLPYSSIYIQLDTRYWSADAEKRLRAAMQPK